MNINYQIHQARNLADLCEVLNNYKGSHRENIDFSSMPTFGGKEPGCVHGIYSWSPTSIIRCSQYGFYLSPRKHND